MTAPVLLLGQVFGRLTVIGDAGSTRHGKRRWLCRCECGQSATVIGSQLRSGRTRSCGCLHRERAAEMGRQPSSYKHGGSDSPTYRIWIGVISRCENPRATHYSYYGGRGIRVCDRWRRSYEAFLADMGERPPGLTIDRIDPDGDYEPGNCRWATRSEQRRNQRAVCAP
jgi:hypothetical protein